MDISQPAPKHPDVPGIDLPALKLVFSTERGDFIDMPAALRLTRMTIEEFDQAMHAAAKSGYVRHVTSTIDDDWPRSGWQVGTKATRLALDRMGPRLSRAQADHVIETLIARARAINAEPDHIHRIGRITLFGSALQDQADYGDVDVSVEILRRKLEEPEQDRLEAHWKELAPASQKRAFLGVLPGSSFDRRDMLLRLKKGLKGLSLMSDDPAVLGTAYRVLYETDENSVEIPVSPGIIAPAPGKVPRDFPELSYEELTTGPTLVRPTGLPGLNEPISLGEVRWITLSDLWQLEGDWPFPAGSRLESLAAFHGAQHLCPAWKTGAPGLQMLAEALDWARRHGARIGTVTPDLRLSIGAGTRHASLGHRPEGLSVNRSADRVEATLLDGRTGAVTTRADLAANFAVCMALGTLIDETALTGNVETSIHLELPGDPGSWVPLPRLAKLAREIRQTTIDHLGRYRARPGKNGRMRIVDAEFIWERNGTTILAGLSACGDMTQGELDRFLDAVILHGKFEDEGRQRLVGSIPGLAYMKMRARREWGDD